MIAPIRAALQATSKTIGADAQSFQFVAIASSMPSSQGGPHPVRPLAREAPQRKGHLATHCRRRITGHLLGYKNHIAPHSAAQPNRHHSERVFRRPGELCNPSLSLHRQHASGPRQAGLHTVVRRFFKCCGQKRGRLFRLLSNRFKCRSPRAQIGTPQRRHGSSDRIKIGCRDFVRRSLGGNPIDAALLCVGHTVASHAGIVPIGHHQRTIRRYADIRWAKPLVGSAIGNRLDCGCIAGTRDCDRIPSYNVHPWLAVHQCAAKPFGQKAPFVHANPGR